MQSITLTQDQQNVVTSVLNFIDSKEQVCVIEGHAGTGKTTVVKHVQEEYINLAKLQKVIDPETPIYTWEFTATTNKAAQALHQATYRATSTIHKLLDITVRTDYKSNSQILVRRKGSQNPDDLIIVVDECSYVDQQLLDLILKATQKCKVIFMGDPSQLTPVGCNDSPVFVQNYPTFKLTEVVRQDKSSPIQQVCADFRKTIQEHVGFPKIDKCAEFIHLTKDDFEAELVKEFAADSWDQSKSKILAWTNKTVEMYNNFIFKQCNQRSEFKTGDYVINNHFVKDIATDKECQILKITSGKDYNILGYQINLDARSNAVFMPKKKSDLEKTKQKAINEGNYTLAQHIDQNWVDLRAAYACTVNKSQGSTYDKVFIDLADLGKCKDAIQLARLLYVAISRAKYQVIFTGDI